MLRHALVAEADGADAGQSRGIQQAGESVGLLYLLLLQEEHLGKGGEFLRRDALPEAEPRRIEAGKAAGQRDGAGDRGPDRDAVDAEVVVHDGQLEFPVALVVEREGLGGVADRLLRDLVVQPVDLPVGQDKG